MNTSFSKYVKQCKWGLGLDTAGSDYSAHNNLGASARTQGSALGGEPCPGRAAALGLPASPLEAMGGRVRRAGGGGLGGPPDPWLPTQEDIPGLGGPGPGGGGDPAPPAWGHPCKVSCLSPITRARDTHRDRDSSLLIYWGSRAGGAEAWGWRRELAIFQKGWRTAASGRREREAAACATQTFPGARAPPAPPAPGVLARIKKCPCSTSTRWPA